MNDLQQIFNYQDQEVRTVIQDGQPWFVAKDVCDVLEIGNPSQALSRLENDEKNTIILNEGIGNPNKTIVNEPGLYTLILGSRKPEAKQFKRWITHDVIPTIRKTGGYVANDDLFIQTYLPQADEQTKHFFKATLQTMKEQSKQIEAMKPKALFADAVETSESSVLVGELAKLLQQNNVQIGPNKLFEWLRENGYLIRKKGESYNLPTQRSMDMGLFEIKKRAVNNPDGSVRTTRTPKVTGKGQVYFINKFLASETA
ncbi:phage antirepressor KilAC domain-containing protein [Bacillus altitudinis]|uniref:phage antirepressor n=1 Tax=Bacillus altitudinis TaxID=293387 RepID=UPI00227E33E9|nr:phage antirepressor KilAC domain-containing protein [Bacillus altitudinis]MCY7630816.1 phage antirepressor KilAC domain-containing protein [Bacillus altitudinis]